jgi:hypothetical protein
LDETGDLRDKRDGETLETEGILRQRDGWDAKLAKNHIRD